MGSLPLADPEKKKAYNRRWNREHKEWHRAVRVRSRRNIKAAVLAHYGNKCECCGENTQAFLTIDHVNGGGTKHRNGGDGRRKLWIYAWLKRNGFPEGYRILCFNCNCGREANGGICPHQQTGGGGQ